MEFGPSRSASGFLHLDGRDPLHYTTITSGSQSTPSFRVFVAHATAIVASIDDIPLSALSGSERDSLNLVVKVSRWTNVYMDVARDEPSQPLKHEIDSQGRLEYIPTYFPLHGCPFNMGFLPQTRAGTGRPLEVCEIGERVSAVGEVRQMKIIALMVFGHTLITYPPRIIAVDAQDPLVSRLTGSIEEDLGEDLIKAIREWFWTHSVKLVGEQVAISDLELLPRGEAVSVIQAHHVEWQASQSSAQGVSGALDLPRAARKVYHLAVART